MEQPTHKFSIGNAVSFGWNTFKEKPLFWVLVSLVLMIVNGINGSIDFSNEQAEPTAEFFLITGIVLLVSLVLWFVMTAIQMGVTRLQLDAFDNEKLEFSTLFSQFNFIKVLKVLVATFIYMLFVVIGLALLIIPGIYWGIKYGFFMHAIVDKDAGIFESFKISSNITKGHKIDLFMLYVITIGIVLLGVVMLLVGVLVAIPVAWLAVTYAYRTLLEEYESPQGKDEVMEEVTPEPENGGPEQQPQSQQAQSQIQSEDKSANFGGSGFDNEDISNDPKPSLS